MFHTKYILVRNCLYLFLLFITCCKALWYTERIVVKGCINKVHLQIWQQENVSPLMNTKYCIHSKLDPKLELTYRQLKDRLNIYEQNCISIFLL